MKLRAMDRRSAIRGGEALEVRCYLTVVASEYLFYNDSAYDGSNPAINSQDDHAIAPDKGAYHVQSDEEVPADGQVIYGVGNNAAAPVWSRDRDPDSVSTEQWTAVARIPTPLITAPDGTLLSFVELRNNWLNDANAYGFGLKISRDNGSSWSEVIQLENKNPPTGDSTVRLSLGASFVLPDGRIGLVYSYWTEWSPTSNGGTVTVWEMYSQGTDYTSWTAPNEITSSVVKVNNSMPAGLPTVLDGTDGAWDYLLPTSAVTLANGNVVVGAVYRYAVDPDAVSRFCTLQRDTGGNWKLLGGLSDGNAGTHFGEPFRNMGVNESTMALDANGNIRAIFRHKNFDQLHTSVSTDGGATWSGAAPTAILQAETQASIVSNPNNRNEMFLATVNDSIRSNMTVFRSTNGGLSWTGGSRVFYAGRASYPGLQFMDDGRLILLYENSKDYGPYPHEYQYISQVRFTPADLQEPDSALWYQFNERSSGFMISGPSVFSQGMDLRGFGQTAWSYSPNGVVANGMNGLTLAQGLSGTMGNAFANRQDSSFTAEVVVDLANTATGATQSLFGNYAGSGKGWEIYISAIGKVSAIISDNSGVALTLTHPADLTIGSRTKSIALIFDMNANTYTLYVDGVAGPAIANTEIGSLVNSFPTLVGARATGANAVAGGTEFRQVRFTREAREASDLLNPYTPKTPFLAYLGYTPPTLPSYAPTYNEHAKLWLGGLADGGMQISGDIGTTLAPLDLPVQRTTGTAALTDAITGKLFKRGVPSEVVVDSDTTVGQYYYANRTWMGGNAGLSTVAPDTTWDFIHESSVYTIVLGAFKFQSNTFTDQIMLTNAEKAIGNDGFTLIRLGNGKLLFTMTNDSAAWRTNYTTTKTFDNNKWYTLAISCAGDGKAVNLYWAEWPGDMAMPATLTWEFAGFVQGDNSDPFTQPSQRPLSVGSASDGSLASDWSYKDIMIFDVAMSPSVILNTLQTVVWKPSTLATTSNVSNYLRGINGLMVDLVDLPPGTTLTANDFQFRIGNNNSPDTWALAPAPTAISIRPGAGVNGSDRLTITWANGAIKNTWLQVTIRGNDATGGHNTNTGLARSHTFYFGNKIADSGTNPPASRFETTSTDAAQVYGSIGPNKPITDPRDYNRDGQITSTDAAIVLGNIGSIVRLNLAGAIGGPAAAAPLAAPSVLPALSEAEPLSVAAGQPTLVPTNERSAATLPLVASRELGIAAGLTISAEQSKRPANQTIAEFWIARQADPAVAPLLTQQVLLEGARVRSYPAHSGAKLTDAALETTEDLLDSLLG